jgi:superfamily I DNA/RNA helicase
MALKPTQEQISVRDCDDKEIVVLSGAGTGKTSVLEMFAAAKPKSRMLYLAFSKAIQEEATERFNRPGSPNNVHCRTTHAIAFARHGRALSHKLEKNMRLTDIKNLLDTPNWGLVKDVQKAFQHYLNSPSLAIGEEHARHLPTVTAKQKIYMATVLSGAEKLWDACRDPENPFPSLHDVYLKLYCLQEPEWHKWFDYVLLDEAQDTNPVVEDLFLRQACKKVMVGDDHQQIFTFRGARNAIDGFIKNGATVLQLTQSFRFGPAICEMARAVLAFKHAKLGGRQLDLKGNPSIEDAVYPTLPAALVMQPHAILHRTVAGTLETALTHKNKRLLWIGGLENYNLQELLDVYYLSRQQPENIKRKKLKQEHRSFDHYKAAADQLEDFEMQRIIKIIDSHGSSLPRNIALLRKNQCRRGEQDKAELFIGTAHRSKGLEFNAVILHNDFTDIVDRIDDIDAEILCDELNLIYVAITRAIKHLQPADNIVKIANQMGWRFKRSDNQPTLARPAGGKRPAQRITLSE